MNDYVLLMKQMISYNPYMIVKQECGSCRFIARTLWIDEEGNIWCWTDEDAAAGVEKLPELPVCLTYADKGAGRFMIARGNAGRIHLSSSRAAALAAYHHRGSLWKISVSECGYFRKQGNDLNAVAAID